MKGNDPVATYFDKLAEAHKRQFKERASGANFNFQQRLKLACELGDASSGELLDCAAGTGEITCALVRSGRFNHATVLGMSAAMLQSAKDLLTTQITEAELEFIQSDVFNFKPSDSRFDLILCLGLIAHAGRLDILLPHLKSILTPGGRIILQTTLTDHLGTQIFEMRRHSLGIPFGDRLWRWANFQLERRLQKWASRHGADAIYLLPPG